MLHASQKACKATQPQKGFSTKDTHPEGQGTVLSVLHVATP